MIMRRADLAYVWRHNETFFVSHKPVSFLSFAARNQAEKSLLESLELAARFLDRN